MENTRSIPPTGSREILHFGNTARGPTDDSDGDGTRKHAEFLLGLDPSDGTSAFRATILPASGGFTLTWSPAHDGRERSDSAAGVLRGGARRLYLTFRPSSFSVCTPPPPNHSMKFQSTRKPLTKALCGSFLAVVALLTSPVATAELSARFIPDEMGRELVPGGFVAITEDRKGVIRYTADDYRRMVRMGANFQVIRLSLGRLGGWPGTTADPTYPAQLDEMVRMGREAGMKTIFKLVVYGIKSFGPGHWEALWKNADGSQDALIEAWRNIWIRYKEDPSVFGYDLLNEPQRGLEPDEHRCVRESLVPTLWRLTDAMHAVSPEKWALYQPLFRDSGNGVGPFTPMREALGRDRVIYAPHMYTTNLKTMRETLDRYEREAALSKAPLLLGEWGPSVALTVDDDPQRQAFYTNVYQATAGAPDRRRIGGIKAWFCGSRSPLENKKSKTKYTWALFSDTLPVGRVERKYLVDSLARPRPLVVAGRLESYGFHFGTRTLRTQLNPDAALGATELFVPKDRFYPAGFRVEIGTGLVMASKPGVGELDVIHSAGDLDSRQSRRIRWDDEKQRLVIDAWEVNTPGLDVKIVPLDRR
jgi:hypothetical protein